MDCHNCNTSCSGPRGRKGDTGEKGKRGKTGPTGPAGIQGIRGLQGIQGPAGPTGASGVQGIQGPAGAQGIQGVAGPVGPTGGFNTDTLCSVLGSTGVSLNCIRDVVISGATGGNYLCYDENTDTWVNSNIECQVVSGSDCNNVALACDNVRLLQPPAESTSGISSYTLYQGVDGSFKSFWQSTPDVNNSIIHTTSVTGITGSIPISPIGMSPDYDLSSIVVTELPVCGTLSSINATDPFTTYTANNITLSTFDVFTYTIDRITECGNIKETVKEFVSNCLEPKPYANNNKAVTCVGLSAGEPVDINVLSNDINIIGDPTVNYKNDVSPVGPSITVDPTTQAINFVPQAGVTGTYNFTYDVTSLNGTTNTANVCVDVLFNPFCCIPPPATLNLVFSLDISGSVSSSEYTIYKQSLLDSLTYLQNVQTNFNYTLNTCWISFGSNAVIRSPGTFDNPTYLNVVSDAAAIQDIINGMPYGEPSPRFTNWDASTQALHVISGAATTPNIIYWITDGAPNIQQTASEATWSSGTASTSQSNISGAAGSNPFNVNNETGVTKISNYITNDWGATPKPIFYMLGIAEIAVVNPPYDGDTFFNTLKTSYDNIGGDARIFTNSDWNSLEIVVTDAINNFCE